MKRPFARYFAAFSALLILLLTAACAPAAASGKARNSAAYRMAASLSRFCAPANGA